MIQAVPKTMNLDEFLDWYPDGYGRFELYDGVVVEMQPTGTHEQVAALHALKLGVEIERLSLPYGSIPILQIRNSALSLNPSPNFGRGTFRPFWLPFSQNWEKGLGDEGKKQKWDAPLPYFVARQCIIKPVDSDKSGFIPDVTVLDWNALETEPLWKKRSLITKGETVRLAIEVVSTNWQDDYLIKLAEYEKLGIPEYWIVDYLGLGGKRYIGNPKRPVIVVYSLVDGEYMVSEFRENQRIESPTFPELNLTAERVFRAGQ